MQFVEQGIAYSEGGQAFEGWLVYAEGGEARPALLMAPNWMGVSEAAKVMARKVAAEGYVVMVTDVYGVGVRPQNADEALAAMMPLKEDRELLRRRLSASLEALRGQAGSAPIDLARMAAFGFCFGGCCALDLGRIGAELKAFVSFHGTLDATDPAQAANIRGKVLVLDGAIDPLVDRAQLPAFVAEMQGANVDWQLVSYAGAAHSFTDPNAQVPGKMQYDERVSGLAFTAMYRLFDEVFA